MMPGGHLATAIALTATSYAATGSTEVAAGCFAGGFLIDVDHYLDYLIFEKQWRRPSPTSFLKYYFAYRPQKLVLPLHSFELMSAMLAGILFYPIPIIVGYWFGAAMHLTFDLLVNGEYALKRVALFYFFTYRAANRFAAARLTGHVPVPPDAVEKPILDFFRWRPAFPVRETADAKAEKPRTFDLAQS